MSVLLAVLSFVDIVALTFLNGYWVSCSIRGVWRVLAL
jgi:hypothetical protein